MPDINVGQLSDIINNKLDINCYNANPVTTPEGLSSVGMKFVIETYENGTSGYRIWSDGYCEQWGSNCSSGTITFLKKFADTNIVLTMTRNSPYEGGISSAFHGSWTKIPTTTGFTCFYDSNTPFSWKASGYLAEGEY